MCGIAGIMVKKDGDLGEALFKMLYEIRHRGCDATGTSLYLDQPRDYVEARVSLLDPAEDLPLLRSIAAHLKKPCAALDDFDGVFSFLAATETHIGAVRDRLGIKPILFYQSDDLLLLGSEQVSFEAVNRDIFATEMAPGEVRLWSKN
ncbi:MAG TPA: hypothetical protein VJ020_07750 [Anaerolineales bacterium]|nr:hypothetical protein [Anaerolineales bacterium]